MTERVEVRQNVLKENDRIAGDLRDELASRRHPLPQPHFVARRGQDQHPGGHARRPCAGAARRVAVLTGDIQTERDAERLRRYGFPALQITTGGTCHLDAGMVRRALGGALAGRPRRPVHRERRQPRLPGILRPRRGREGRRAQRRRRRRQAAEVPGHLPARPADAAPQDRPAALHAVRQGGGQGGRPPGESRKSRSSRPAASARRGWASGCTGSRERGGEARIGRKVRGARAEAVAQGSAARARPAQRLEPNADACSRCTGRPARG